jgi:hypothetical protein
LKNIFFRRWGIFYVSRKKIFVRSGSPKKCILKKAIVEDSGNLVLVAVPIRHCGCEGGYVGEPTEADNRAGNTQA